MSHRKPFFMIGSILFLFIFCHSLDAQIRNVRVDNPDVNRPNEVTIAINPSNPEFIAAGSNLNYFYYSSDAGETWTSSVMQSSLGVWGDPVLLYNSTGILYYSHLADNRNKGNGYWIDRIVVQRSFDNGLTWDDGVGIGFAPPRKQQDKEWLAIDLTNLPSRNNVYMSWTEFDEYGSSETEDHTRILFSRSTDHGFSWSNPVKISDVEGNCLDGDNTVEGAVPTVGPNGEVYLSWSGPEGIMFDKSLDAGVTFGVDIPVTQQPGGWAFDIPGINRCNGMPITGCDISGSPYNGNIYINWSHQARNEEDTDIFLIKSTDGGETWGEVKRVNNDSTTRHQFFTWMTIDQTSGNIYIVFYDRRNTIGLDTEVYLARSTDGGETFENYKISDSQFTPNNQVFFGDYTNIAAHQGKIYPIWMRMDGFDMSVWTAIIDDSELVTGLVEENDSIVAGYRLFDNYPNPFNPTTVISYQIPEYSFVSVKVYDLLGNEMYDLVSDYKDAGVHEINFDASELPSGVYIYKITAGSFIKSNKMMLVK